MDKRRWTDLGSDVSWEDYGGTWGRKGRDGAWYVIRFENGVEHVGERGVEAGELPRYMAEVKRVDLRELSPEKRKDVARSCDVPDDACEEQWVEACVSYGLSAPLYETSGDKYPARVREDAVRAALAFMRDAVKLETALDRQVNRVGTTAREFGRGELVFRNMDDPSVKLAAKLQGLPTDDATVATAKEYGIAVR